MARVKARREREEGKEARGGAKRRKGGREGRRKKRAHPTCTVVSG